MRSALSAALLVLALGALSPVFGQLPVGAPPKAPADSQPAVQDPLGRDTPRGTVLGFVRAASANRYETAIQYLDGRREPARAAELASQLKAIIDRRLSTADLEQLSTSPEGTVDDDLPPNQERVGEVKREGGSFEILLERVQRKGMPPVWLFSAKTLAQVPRVYEEVRPMWLEQFMGAPLRERRVLGTPLWHWIAIAIAIPLVLAFAWLLNRLLLLLLRPLLARLAGQQAEQRLKVIMAPMRVLALAAAIAVWVGITRLPLLTRFFWSQVSLAVGIVGLSWLILRLIDLAGALTEDRFRRQAQPGRIAIAELLRRLGKVLVVLSAGLALLSLAGLDLTAALAGLGIGGLAVAFAAQKTLESLFGGVTLISDQPIRVGDFCRIGEVVGVIEEIGLHSTRVRTLDRTVVSIPNSQMAATNLENFGVRDKIWFKPTIGLRYETTADQLRYVLAQIRQMLYAHPMVETQGARVRFVRFGGSSLDVEIFAYVLTSDYPKFVEIQEDLLLRIMDIVEASGTGIAFPSQTTYLARDSGLDEAKRQAAIAAVKAWREAGDLPFPDFRPAQIAEIRNRLPYPSADSAVRREGA